ncbi:MAG: hypothetical protein U5K37_08125 [Natrialbaceae archaeon]|nr:hypothetical protein [Natrialbaceae archaeon]
MRSEPVRREEDDIRATYRETAAERQLELERGDRHVVLAQNAEGYAMVAVRVDDTDLESYYGFDMALDHAAEVLGVSPHTIPIPEPARSMGM